MNVNQVAELCSTVNRAYCRQLGDMEIPEWFGAPAWYQESTIAGVQLVLSGLRKGLHLAAWDIHNAWMQYKLKDGWTHGEKKDPEAKTHPNLVPFEQLTKEEQRKDYLFIAVIEACYRAGGIDP